MRSNGARRALVLFMLGAFVYSVGAHAGPTWRYFSQPAAQSVPVFVDLDGDGTNELAYVGRGTVFVHEWVDGTFRLADALPIRPAEGGDLRLVPAQGQEPQKLMVTVWDSLWRSRIVEVAGKPLAIQREFPGFQSANVVAIEDIDSDGEHELLVQSINEYPRWVRLIDYTTQAEEWSVGHQDGFTGLYAVGSLGTPGAPWVLEWRSELSIRSGATGLTHWNFPWESPAKLLTARLAPDATQGFIVTRFHSTLDTAIQVFHGLPPVPGTSYTIRGVDVTVFDVNEDGVDEAIVVPHATAPAAAFHVHDLQTGSRIETLPSTQSLPSPPGFGAVSESGPLLMAYTGRFNAFSPTIQPTSLSVLDLSTRNLVLEPERRAIRLHSSLFADVDGDGGVETIVLGVWPSRSAPGQQQFEVHVFSDDGDLLYQRGDLADEGLDAIYPVTITAGNLDGVPGDELVIVGRNGTQSNVVLALDGSLDTRWRKVAGEDDWPQRQISHAILAPAAAGGMDVLMIATGGATSSALQVRGSSGELLGHTPLANATVVHGLAVAQMDADPAPEIVIHTGEGAQWVDAWSRVVEGSLAGGPGEAWSTILAWQDASRCNLGLQRFAVMTVVDCQTREGLYDVVVPGGSTVLGRDTTRDRAFFATHNGHLLRVQHGQSAQDISGYLGEGLSAVRTHMVTPAVGVNGDVEITMTSESFAMRHRVEGRNLIFRDSFGNDDVAH